MPLPLLQGRHVILCRSLRLLRSSVGGRLPTRIVQQPLKGSRLASMSSAGEDMFLGRIVVASRLRRRRLQRPLASFDNLLLGGRRLAIRLLALHRGIGPLGLAARSCDGAARRIDRVLVARQRHPSRRHAGQRESGEGPVMNTVAIRICRQRETTTRRARRDVNTVGKRLCFPARAAQSHSKRHWRS